ncbi:HalOD1 output domain-containing protein [Natrinema amylolyticum]|uniref:HalOD1 output domain-containing protein n=1 Tax=Natrinema amylolyticum TaxID=2878679 RepID=UPI001CFBB815|nr:HalOD1 output domain-containing protein [Natrinema amylolyticum]
MEYEIGADEPASIAVVLAVSSAADCDPAALCPLYEAIDPDALNRLFGSRPGTPGRTGLEVTFDFSGYRVTVVDGESVMLRPIQSPEQ